nr:type II toxin-antitoxin system VapC family toxin [Mycolicibacterium sp. J2]
MLALAGGTVNQLTANIPRRHRKAQYEAHGVPPDPSTLRSRLPICDYRLSADPSSGALRRQIADGALALSDARRVIDVWARLGITRYAAAPLLERVCELRDTVTTYDAMYVALAEALDCPLVTADARLSRAPGIRCAVTVIPD